jgi:hypothetical protein
MGGRGGSILGSRVPVGDGDCRRARGRCMFVHVAGWWQWIWGSGIEARAVLLFAVSRVVLAIRGGCCTPSWDGEHFLSVVSPDRSRFQPSRFPGWWVFVFSRFLAECVACGGDVCIRSVGGLLRAFLAPSRDRISSSGFLARGAPVW